MVVKWRTKSTAANMMNVGYTLQHNQHAPSWFFFPLAVATDRPGGGATGALFLARVLAQTMPNAATKA
jgi:hypothetical protein